MTFVNFSYPIPIPVVVKRVFNSSLVSYELVKPEYLQPSIPFYGSIFAFDLNEDNVKDYTLHVVSFKKKIAAFYVLLSFKKSFKLKLLSKYIWKGHQKKPICRAMELKKRNEKGLSERDYFPWNVKGEKRNKIILDYVNSSAIETNYPHLSNGSCMFYEGSLDIEDTYYCSEGYYFIKNRLKKAMVCD